MPIYACEEKRMRKISFKHRRPKYGVDQFHGREVNQAYWAAIIAQLMAELDDVGPTAMQVKMNTIDIGSIGYGHPVKIERAQWPSASRYSFVLRK